MSLAAISSLAVMSESIGSMALSASVLQHTATRWKHISEEIFLGDSSQTDFAED